MTEPVRVEPMDEHNEILVRNVHPPGRQNPEPADRYRLVVVGAGTAGLVTAAGAAGLGARVALVERHLLGGDCLNVGCVPSKTLIRSARAAHDARSAGEFGVRVPEGVEVDFPAVMERLRRLRARISRHDSVERFTGLGVDVFLGQGRFTGRDKVEVDGKTLRFKTAVIATGAHAVEPPVPGLKEAGFLTNETVFTLTELPRRLAVLGAGPLGCELAQAFRRMGSEVTIIERASQILTREDPDAAKIVQESFRRDGVDTLFNSTVRSVGVEGGAKRLELDVAGEERTIAVDEILVGAGRAPNVEGLGLEEAGVAYGRHGVEVDDSLRTTNRRIYAAGDVCLRFKFTHTADASARIVLQNALFPGTKRLSALTVPWCTYTDPEIAHVGMYERDAGERGIEVETFTRRFEDVDRAITDGEEDGLLKVHVRKGTDGIIGATVVARHAGEMISEVTLAMVEKIGLGKIAGVIHPYPTQAEAIRQAADAYNRTRLTPFVKRLFRWWLK
jgi:pyruvate/2-oxoglutarate dehydrogenase complex dihydrolipoamide dehydrogenase (E3) component